MGQVCYSLQKCEVPEDLTYFRSFLRLFPEATIEIRFDKVNLDIFSFTDFVLDKPRAPIISTFRITSDNRTSTAVELLSRAISEGSEYIDLDISFPEQQQKWLISLAMNYGCKVILSYHNATSTDSLPKLKSIANAAYAKGADIVKIVTTATCKEDADRVLSLYKSYRPDTLIAFAMGKEGIRSRFDSFEMGSPMLYVAPTRKAHTASGQPAYYDMLPGKETLLQGKAEIPSSKSFAQRAIFLAALTDGTSKLYNLTLCEDTMSAISLAKQFGAEVDYSPKEGTLTVTGHQNLVKKGLVLKEPYLFVGESGLLARLCIPLAGLTTSVVTISGEKTLLKRKMDHNSLDLMDIGLFPCFRLSCYLPANVIGEIKCKKCTFSGSDGSQLISGLLIALSQCRRKSTLKIVYPTSAPYLDLTQHLLACFGVTHIECEDPEDDIERVYHIASRQQLKPVLGIEVERDWSSAAFLLVAGALMGDVTISGMDPFSFQADIAILSILESCHADIHYSHDQRTVNVRKSLLSPFDCDITNAPDLFAPLVLLALRANGISVITGIERLANKESNRARTFLSEFRKLGAKVKIKEDVFIIEGSKDNSLRGGKCSSHGDHRLAMALSIAALIADNPVEIDKLECINKSFPDFLKTLDALKTDKGV